MRPGLTVCMATRSTGKTLTKKRVFGTWDRLDVIKVVTTIRSRETLLESLQLGQVDVEDLPDG